MFAVLFAGMSLLFVIYFGSTVVQLLRFRGRALRVPGRVTALRHEWEPSRPVVAFTTVDGRWVEGNPSIAMDNHGLFVGSEVTVLYDPAHPKKAYPRRYLGFLLVVTVAATLLSLGFLAVGVFGAIVAANG